MRSQDQTFLDPFQSANRIGHWLPLLILLSFLSSISSFSNGGVSTKIPFQFVGDSSGIEFEHRNGMQSELWLLEVIGSGARCWTMTTTADWISGSFRVMASIMSIAT